MSEAELDARLELEMENLAGSGDPVALARAASRITSFIGDAHLVVGLGPEVMAGPLVPFLLKRAGERVFLDASDPPMPLGTEVLTVDGRPVDELLGEMAELAAVDGERPGVRVAEAERRFSFLALMELGVRESYELVVRRPGAEPETIVLEATDREGVSRMTATRHSWAIWGTPPPRGAPPWPTLTRIADDTMLLRLSSFAWEDAAAYQERVASLFAGLAPEERLVIDLRGNEGGNRMLGVAVLRHLLFRPFAQWSRVSTRVRAIPLGFDDFISFPIAPEAALREFPGDERGQRWLVEGDPLAERMVPVSNPHPGPLVVFVDDATNSAAVEFVVALLAHREGVRLIGTETQGACDRHAGQLPVLFQSDTLAAFVSLFEIELVPIRRCQPGCGIVPDERVVYSEADFLAGHDPYLDAL